VPRQTNLSTNLHSTASEIATQLAASLAGAARFDLPFRHFFAEGLLSDDVVDALAQLPIGPLCLDGLSGRREYHNHARCFFSADNAERFPTFGRVAEALQSQLVVAAIIGLCGAPLAGTFLRIEYAADGDGFWLEPHTDLGVKKFTCFISLAKSEAESDLGTDLYSDDKMFYKRVPFRRGAGLIFVPGQTTWHGFAPRPIADCRRSLIVNYVSSEWRERAQLAFPMEPVG
jgi:hypothetical protein